MAKLTLQPKPTFEAKVGIPAAGAGVLPVVFTFKHRTRTELKNFVAGLGDFASDGGCGADVGNIAHHPLL